MKMSEDTSLEKYTSHFIWKGYVSRESETRTELQHIDPHSIGHNCVFFPVLLGCSTGGQASLGHVSHSTIFSQLVCSLTGLIPNCNCSIGGLRDHSAGYWLYLPHLVSNWPGRQTAQSGAGLPTLLGAGFLYSTLSPTGPVSKLTDFLSSLSYIIVQRSLLFVGVTIALIQPIHGQGYNSDIPRPDAPVIYIGAFPILTARLGRKPIYNRCINFNIS